VQAHDALALGSAIDWTPIVVALITLSGVVFNALVGAFVVYQLRTPSGMRIGKQVEAAHHVSLANNYRIQSLASALGEAGEPDVPNARKREADDAG
jgi:hypothetical protein